MSDYLFNQNKNLNYLNSNIIKTNIFFEDEYILSYLGNIFKILGKLDDAEIADLTLCIDQMLHDKRVKIKWIISEYKNILDRSFLTSKKKYDDFILSHVKADNSDEAGTDKIIRIIKEKYFN